MTVGALMSAIFFWFYPAVTPVKSKCDIRQMKDVSDNSEKKKNGKNVINKQKKFTPTLAFPAAPIIFVQSQSIQLSGAWVHLLN